MAIGIILGLFTYFIGDLAGSIKQGLDLQGGTHIVLEAEDTAQGQVTDDFGRTSYPNFEPSY